MDVGSYKHNMNAWMNKLSWWTIIHFVCVLVNIWSFAVTGWFFSLFVCAFCGYLMGQSYREDMEKYNEIK